MIRGPAARALAPLALAAAIAEGAGSGCGGADEPAAPRCLASAFSRARLGPASVVPSTAPAGDVDVVDLVDLSGRWLLASASGRVARVAPEAAGAPEVVADLAPAAAGGRLLAIAALPDGDLFASLVAPAATGFEHLVLRVPRRGDVFDVGARETVISVPRPDDRTPAGRIAFGPDGALYVPVGDGSTIRTASDATSLLGKVLRLDVAGTRPYASPPDNPFSDGARGRPEIWALGLRDPGRPAFDAEAGTAWVTDIGEVTLEVNRLERGATYGWPERDGRACRGGGDTCPETREARPPEVSRVLAGTGPSLADVVTPRGADPLRGRLVLLDAKSGTLDLVDPLGPAGASATTPLAPSGARAIGVTDAGVAIASDGRVSLLRFPEAREAGAPTSLVATACAGPNATPGPSAIRYDVASPLWSDGAEKRRWLFLPPGAKIAVRPDGDLELPVGAVVVKSFLLEGRNIETRLLVHAEQGAWDGYTYEWRRDQSDAELLRGGKTTRVAATTTWTFPSRVECTACHTAAAGFTLGLDLRQLPAAPDRLGGLGERLAASPDLARFPPFPSVTDATAPSEARARAYLHANCAGCHRPGAAPTPAVIDLRADADLRGMDVCAAPLAGGLGLTGARIVAPGAPERSVLSARIRALDHARMPKLASRVVDAAGADAVDAWIRGVSCP